jgi:hypothetical protein
MPFHRKAAYDGTDCYGMSKEELGEVMPGRAEKFLSDREIVAVADFIVGYFQGRTELADADCAIFFGVDSKTCQHVRETGVAVGGSGH